MQLDDWMEAWEAAEARREAERQAALAEDGWTVVVRSKVGVVWHMVGDWGGGAGIGGYLHERPICV